VSKPEITVFVSFSILHHIEAASGSRAMFNLFESKPACKNIEQ
jgi:hypothetical protein